MPFGSTSALPFDVSATLAGCAVWARATEAVSTSPVTSAMADVAERFIGRPPDRVSEDGTIGPPISTRPEEPIGGLDGTHLRADRNSRLESRRDRTAACIRVGIGPRAGRRPEGRDPHR